MFALNAILALERIYLTYYCYVTVGILIYLLIFQPSFLRISLALLAIISVIMSYVLLQLLAGFALTATLFAHDLPESCVAKSCEKIGSGDCDLSDEHWTVYKYIGQTYCACCKAERDAATLAGK